MNQSPGGLQGMGDGAVSGHEPGGFSWGALLYGPVYYWAMGDWPFLCISALAGFFVYTIPLLVPLAFLARKRAWRSKRWESEARFWQVQRAWDRSAAIGFLLSVLVLYGVSQYVFSVLSTTFGTSDPDAVLRQAQELYQEE